MRPPARRAAHRETRNSNRSNGARAERSSGRLRDGSNRSADSNSNTAFRSTRSAHAGNSTANKLQAAAAAAAAGTAAKRLTRSNATAADLVPPLQGSGSSRRSITSSSSSGGGSSKTVTCSICLEDVAVSKMHRMGACRHSFCRSCLSSFLQNALKSKDLPASCPAPRCSAGVSAKDATYIFAGKTRLAAQFNKANKEATAISKGTAIYCPTSSCSKVINIRKPSAAAARKLTPAQRIKAQLNLQKGSCSHCNKNCCTSCRGPWHAGLSCSEYKALPAAEKGEDDMALWELSASKEWKRCPNCKSLVERIDGCSYMMCRCKQPFCYRCGDLINICYSKGCLTGRPWGQAMGV